MPYVPPTSGHCGITADARRALPSFRTPESEVRQLGTRICSPCVQLASRPVLFRVRRSRTVVACAPRRPGGAHVKKKPAAAPKSSPVAARKKAARAVASPASRKAVAPKAIAPKTKKKTAPARGGAGPSSSAEQASDMDLAVGPYGDLISKKDLGLLVYTRTRVS